MLYASSELSHLLRVFNLEVFSEKTFLAIFLRSVISRTQTNLFTRVIAL